MSEKTPENLDEKENPVAEIEEKAIETARPQTEVTPVRRYRTYTFLAILIAILGGFIALAVLASTAAYFPLDLLVTRYLQSDHAAWLSRLMYAISWFGFSPEAEIGTIAAIMTVFFFGFRWEATSSMIAAISEEVVNFGVKYLIHRPRPSANLVHVVAKVGGYSFPSGHVMFYTVFFGFLWFLIYTVLKPSAVRTILLSIFGILILLVGVSRIYEGEHWSSDVLGGYMIGFLILIGMVYLYRWGKTRFFVNQPVAPSKGERGA